MSNTIPDSPILDSAYDFVTLVSITAILGLSFVSLTFIFHLCLRSRTSHHLQSFNSLWTVRFLLVTFVSLWAINELLRLPFFRRKYLDIFSSALTADQQANLCKINVVLSLGFFEPGFLITLLFLVNVSIKKDPPNGFGPVAFVFATCFPFLLLQMFSVVYPTMMHDLSLPIMFQQSALVSIDNLGETTTFCAYPLISTMIFGVFGCLYCLSFMFSCGQVAYVVINKGLRIRTLVLAFVVLVTLPLQILFMGMSVMWSPESREHEGVVLIVFFCSLVRVAVGEGIVVIKPIADSLAVGGICCTVWGPGIKLNIEQEPQHV
ncbi:hypothetical protein ACFE04_010414 [Oxalis oulophora]